MIVVNIIVAHGDAQWIGGRFARELCERLPEFGVQAWINGPDADLEYQQIVYDVPTRRPAVGLFTHGYVRPQALAQHYDGHLTFSSTLAGWLTEAGASEPMVLPYPVDDRIRRDRPLVFGVSGRVYGDGRKGEELVRRMVDAGYIVRAWGQGWPCEIVSADLADLPAFYASLDYYVETSTDEGGCVPAAEAAAVGVPVISHTVGVTRPIIPYLRGNADDLLRVLRELTEPCRYDEWARMHAGYFNAVIGRLEAAA